MSSILPWPPRNTLFLHAAGAKHRPMAQLEIPDNEDLEDQQDDKDTVSTAAILVFCQQPWHAGHNGTLLRRPSWALRRSWQSS